MLKNLRLSAKDWSRVTVQVEEPEIVDSGSIGSIRCRISQWLKTYTLNTVFRIWKNPQKKRFKKNEI